LRQTLGRSRARVGFEFKDDGYRVLASKEQLLTRNKKGYHDGWERPLRKGT
jgi:hypothetical protein